MAVLFIIPDFLTQIFIIHFVESRYSLFIMTIASVMEFGMKTFQIVFVSLQLMLLYTLTFTQLNEHWDWLIFGHLSLIKFKCIPIGTQLSSCCPPVARDQCI